MTDTALPAIDKSLDTRGLNCPLPILKAKKALAELVSGQVLEVIRDMKRHDVSVIIVSHNMQQLMSVADRITVMRLGRSIATRTVKDTNVSEIVGLITGAIPGDSAEARAAQQIPA